MQTKPDSAVQADDSRELHFTMGQHAAVRGRYRVLAEAPSLAAEQSWYAGYDSVPDDLRNTACATGPISAELTRKLRDIRESATQERGRRRSHTVNAATPRRIQRKRTRGWKMPANTRCVTRPGKFGNPYPTCSAFRSILNAALDGTLDLNIDTERRTHMARIAADLEELRGKNLACFCSLGQPCHADALLELANR